MADAAAAKREKKRGLVSGEILSTEQRYVDDMTTLVDVFLGPLKARVSGDVLLTSSEINGIFSTIEQLVRAPGGG